MRDESSEYIAGRKLQNDFAAFCNKAAESFDAFDFLNGPASEMRKLCKNVIHPFNIAVFGRMKAGKSTLINALVGKSLAVTGVEEATATINVLSHSDTPGTFVAHWKDAPPETFPLASLQSDWNGKTDDVLARVKRVSFLELFSDAESLKLCEITDTPGTGSEASVHEDVTQSFLAATEKQGRRADAIIYVFSSVGRESDLSNLETYRKNNCLPGSDPYNSVAVFHKWDPIFWENGGDMNDIRAKAARLKDVMSAVVADVIPVSGPLALAAVEASDAYWNRLLDFCRSKKWEELERLISRDEKWDRDDTRKDIRTTYSLPWASFQIIVREISKNIDECMDVASVRNRILRLSGIQNLKTFLDENFFKRGELIRQKQTYNEILRIKTAAYSLIERRIETLEKDHKAWEKLFRDGKYDGDLQMARWIAQRRYECVEESDSLKHSYADVDRTFINSEIRERIEDADNLAWAESMLAQGRFFTTSEVQTLKQVFLRLSIGNEGARPGDEEVYALYENVANLSNHVQSSVRDNASRIMQRLSMFLQ